MDIDYQLKRVHSYLMSEGFPYHSVSVIYRGDDLGLHALFISEVKDKVTEVIRGRLKAYGFGYSFVG